MVQPFRGGVEKHFSGHYESDHCLISSFIHPCTLTCTTAGEGSAVPRQGHFSRLRTFACRLVAPFSTPNGRTYLLLFPGCLSATTASAVRPSAQEVTVSHVRVTARRPFVRLPRGSAFAPLNTRSYGQGTASARDPLHFYYTLAFSDSTCCS